MYVILVSYAFWCMYVILVSYAFEMMEQQQAKPSDVTSSYMQDSGSEIMEKWQASPDDGRNYYMPGVMQWHYMCLIISNYNSRSLDVQWLAMVRIQCETLCSNTNSCRVVTRGHVRSDAATAARIWCSVGKTEFRPYFSRLLRKSVQRTLGESWIRYQLYQSP